MISAYIGIAKKDPSGRECIEYLIARWLQHFFMFDQKLTSQIGVAVALLDFHLKLAKSVCSKLN